MTHYKISSVTWESSKEEFGDDMVYFTAIVVSDEDPEVCVPLLLDFRRLIKHASQESPMITKILDDAQKYIKGWGPQESSMIRELEECGFDISQLAKKAFESLFDLKQEAMRQAKRKANLAPIEAIANEFDSLVPDIKKETVNYYQLCEQLERVISDTVLKQYPVIINSSPDNIREFQSILVNHISELSGDLVNLIEKSESE